VGWTYAEVVGLVVHHLLGFRPGLHDLVIRPRLLDGLDRMSRTFILRDMEVRLTVERGSGKPSATVNGKPVAMDKGMLKIPFSKKASPEKKPAKKAKGKKSARVEERPRVSRLEIRIVV
jgi:cellobiose phosphorylase